MAGYQFTAVEYDSIMSAFADLDDFFLTTDLDMFDTPTVPDQQLDHRESSRASDNASTHEPSLPAPYPSLVGVSVSPPQQQFFPGWTGPSTFATVGPTGQYGRSSVSNSGPEPYNAMGSLPNYQDFSPANSTHLPNGLSPDSSVLSGSSLPSTGSLTQETNSSVRLQATDCHPSHWVSNDTSSSGRTAAEILAGLDLDHLLQPPKPSRAKRIRGHVRRLNELHGQLADKVRQIQKLAAENSNLRHQARVLELVIQCRDEQMQMLQSFQATPDESLYIQGPSMAGKEPVSQVIPLSTLKSITGAKLLEMFKPVMAEISMALMAAEQNGGDMQGMQRLQNVMATFKYAMQYLRLTNDEVTAALVDTTVTGEKVPVPDEHWLAVVQGLDLSPTQLGDSAILHELSNRWATKIHRERQQLSMNLSQLLSMPRYGAVYREEASSTNTEPQLIDRLDANVMAERCLMVLSAEVFTGKVLTYVQWARAVVHSYPYVFDAEALLTAAATLHKRVQQV